MVSFTLGVGSLTCLPTTRSACSGFTVALALLLAGLGSNWLLWLIVAVLVCGLGLSTRAVRVRVWAADGSTAPTSQTPVPGVYVPRLGLNDRSVSPAGSRSWTVTLLAASGPRSLRVTVKVMVSP